MLKPPPRVAKLGPINHAYFVLISDIDVVKDHREDPDYKYRTYTSCLDAIDLLIKQYNLRYYSETGCRGPLITIQKNTLLKSFEDSFKVTPFGVGLERFWIHGSDALCPGKIAKARELSKWMVEQEMYAAYENGSTIWNHSDVQKALEDYASLEELDHVDTKGLDDTSVIIVDSQDESEMLAAKASRTAKRTFSKADSESDDEIPTKRKPFATASVPEASQKRLRLSQSALEAPAAVEKPSIENVQNMMEQLSKQLSDVSRHLLEHFRLPHYLPSAFDPEVPQPDLQRLYKTCWGNDWPTVGKEIHSLLPAPDLLQSLVSAYLHHHIFKPTGLKWAGYVSDIHATLRAKPTGDRDNTFTKIISSILFKRSPSTHQRLKSLSNDMFTAALHDPNKRTELAAIFLEDLITTLTPVVQHLQKAAEIFTPYEKKSSWRKVLQTSLRILLDTALLIKWGAEMTPHNTFDFVWSGYGEPLVPNTMKTRARSQRDTSAMVLSTLVPGLQVEYQENGRAQFQILRSAEVLERIQPSRPSDADSSAAAVAAAHATS